MLSIQTIAKRSFATLCAAGLAFQLASCSSSTITESDVLDACAAIFDDTSRTHAQDNILLVFDPTASVSGEESSRVPQALLEDLTQASLNDGSLTVIVVDGEDAAPRIAIRNASLSIPQDATSYWTNDQSAAIARCVQPVLLADLRPTSSGTDLGRAMALAAEMAAPDTIIWVWSDFLWTVGTGALDANALSDSPQAAAGRASQALLIDLHGATMKVAGVGNTSTALQSANRSWLRDYAEGLCIGWSASGCEAIKTNPVNFVASLTSDQEDPIPSFPEVTTTCEGQTIKFDFPSALLFTEDSHDVRNDAEVLLAPVVQVLKDNPNASAMLVGHTASISWEPTGQEKSRLRAEGVASVLIAAGIDPSRISTRGAGDQEPLAEDLNPDGTQNENAAAERRVDIMITGVQSCVNQ